MTDSALPLNLDKFSEFLFFEKEPSLQKKKSQDKNHLGQLFTKSLPKAQQRLIFFENPASTTATVFLGLPIAMLNSSALNTVETSIL